MLKLKKSFLIFITFLLSVSYCYAQIETQEVSFEDLNSELRYYQKKNFLRFQFSLGQTTTHITETHFSSITGSFGPELILHFNKLATGFGFFIFKPFTNDEKTIRGYPLERIILLPNFSFHFLNESLIARAYGGFSFNTKSYDSFTYGLGLGFKNQISQYNDLGISLTYLHTLSVSGYENLFPGRNDTIEYAPYFSSFILALDVGFQL